ncbi:hypothetical protein N9M30_04750 [Pseudomonadales bacterium]|nr:hypothetical protein [Pseudomonadales bacterium]
MKSKMTLIRIGYAVVLVILVLLEQQLSIYPALVWGLGFPTVIITMNWRALKYTKRRAISPEQMEKNFAKGFTEEEAQEKKE